jgi:uncharacterized protein
MLVFSTSDGGAAIGAYAPVKVDLPGASSVDVDTNYPYEDEVRVTVESPTGMNLYLRIPGWATNATVDGAPAQAGTMHKVTCGAGSTAVKLELNPEIRIEQWFNKATSVHRGALLYSLPLAANYTVLAHHYGDSDMSNDYSLVSDTHWNVALDVDDANPSRSLRFVSQGYTAGSAPFNHTNWPTRIEATVRQVPSWGVAMNSAAEPPSSPACQDPTKPCLGAEKVQLVPHGGTDLRIGEMPTSGY